MYAAMGVELTNRADRLADLAGAHRCRCGWWWAPRTAGFIGASRRMAEAIPTADLVVIPDAAHSPQFENPAAWWDAVAPFLAARELAR